jgi:hypothetical protein
MRIFVLTDGLPMEELWSEGDILLNVSFGLYLTCSNSKKAQLINLYILRPRMNKSGFRTSSDKRREHKGRSSSPQKQFQSVVTTLASPSLPTVHQQNLVSLQASDGSDART